MSLCEYQNVFLGYSHVTDHHDHHVYPQEHLALMPPVSQHDLHPSGYTSTPVMLSAIRPGLLKGKKKKAVCFRQATGQILAVIH